MSKHRGEPWTYEIDFIYDHEFKGHAHRRDRCRMPDVFNGSGVCNRPPYDHAVAKHRVHEGWVNQFLREQPFNGA